MVRVITRLITKVFQRVKEILGQEDIILLTFGNLSEGKAKFFTKSKRKK